MNRRNMLDQLGHVHEWDIIIIGGGATGLGAAVDAASRGYKTLLIEQFDFSKGTSSRSTKLVHGGVRYLAQGNIKLVRESLKERGLLLKNAAHVCHDIPFVLPSFRWWEKWYYGIGLKFYDLLSGRASLGKTRILFKKEICRLLPAITADKLSGGVLYHDGQFDDSRLAVNLAQTAAAHGACILNYCKLDAFLKSGKRIRGILASDTLSGKQYSLNGKAVINATGVFTDRIIQLDDPGHSPVITVSQGVHIVVDQHFFPGNRAMIIPETDDGRVLFAVPWHDKVVIGTTDTPVAEILIEPKPLQEEIDFIIRHCNRYLTTNITHEDIRSTFAGLRPLISIKGNKATSILPRTHTTLVSGSGLISITGGKWTTYRNMGKSAVDNAIFTGKLEKKDCITETLAIHGCTNEKAPDHLSVYGSDAPGIRKLMDDNPGLEQKIHPALPYFKAEVIWSVRHEMAMTVEDVLSRRTRALILDAKAAIEAATTVAWLMAKEMNEQPAWVEQQVNDFTDIAKQYLMH